MSLDERCKSTESIVREALAELLQCEPGDIALSALLVRDLGLDSYAAVELVSAVEARSQISLSTGAASSVFLAKTVGELVAGLDAALAIGAAEPV